MRAKEKKIKEQIIRNYKPLQCMELLLDSPTCTGTLWAFKPNPNQGLRVGVDFDVDHNMLSMKALLIPNWKYFSTSYEKQVLKFILEIQKGDGLSVSALGGDIYFNVSIASDFSRHYCRQALFIFIDKLGGACGKLRDDLPQISKKMITCGKYEMVEALEYNYN